MNDERFSEFPAGSQACVLRCPHDPVDCGMFSHLQSDDYVL